VLKGITFEARATLDSVCYGGLCSLSVDDMWDLFESLGSYRWQCESTNESFVYPCPPPYDLHAQSPCVYQFKDGCGHDSSCPLDVCPYSQSSDHDLNSCPYYDVSN